MKRDIGSESRFQLTPFVYDAPVRGVSVGILPCHLVAYGITRMALLSAIGKNVDMFIRFDRMYERVGRADGQTDRHRIPAKAALA